MIKSKLGRLLLVLIYVCFVYELYLNITNSPKLSYLLKILRNPEKVQGKIENQSETSLSSKQILIVIYRRETLTIHEKEFWSLIWRGTHTHT